ncbi:extracellular solute-binding protein [Cohnella herbarum]|uniref:Extracellular solute-binding protein n=1 Tax=Cohnella herbarum TaxID=2728023 RepID=A0A7Z2VPH3_9BACL|nr:extracellular solute-binding protein [Cohnella herbarum]QJD86892.1 extracellular solute-binding protein [Cohnella herbarum]
MKRRSWTTIALILAMALIAACSSGNNKETSGSPKASAAASTAKASESAGEASEQPPTKLTMMVQSHPSWPVNKDWLVYRELGALANVQLDVSGYQGDWWEAIPLVIASGDLPDLMWMSGPDIIHQYGSEGALVNLLDHMDKMPNLEAWITDHREITNALLSTDGKLFMNPAQGAYGDWDGLWLYREDIFKKNNLEVPKTYDELFEVLLKLKEIYPDSYPLFLPDWGAMNQIALSFGTENSFYYNEETKSWQYGPTEDNYRQALQFVVDAYEAKLIPVEFGSLDSNKRNEMITTDQSFIVFGYIGHIDTYNNLARAANPDFKIAQFTPPGGAGHPGYHGSQFMFQEGLTVTTPSKNKDAAFKFIDSMFTEKGKEIASWGKEGITFEKAEGGNKYLPIVKDAATRSVSFGLRTAGVNAWFDNEANIALMNEETKASYLEAGKHIKPAGKTVIFTKEERDSIALKQEAIGKYVSENVSKFIIGQRSMSEWDAYVKGVNDLGLSDVLKVYEQAFARSRQ